MTEVIMDDKKSTNKPIANNITKSINESRNLQEELEKSRDIQKENTEMRKLIKNTMISELQALLDNAKNVIYNVSDPKDKIVNNNTITPLSLEEQNASDEVIENELVVIKSDKLESQSQINNNQLTEEDKLKKHTECMRLEANDGWGTFRGVDIPTTISLNPSHQLAPIHKKILKIF